MSNLCLSDGTLQSYYDGQLTPEMVKQVDAHLTVCSRCAEAARQVDSEMELATEAFSAEMALSVPSERLRSRLNTAIEALNARPSLADESTLSRVCAWFISFGSTLNLTPQRTLGFASIVVFFVLAVVAGGIVMRQRTAGGGFDVFAVSQENPGELPELRAMSSETNPPVELPVTRRRTRRPTSIRPRVVGSASNNAMSLAHRQLPGEKNYLQAISLLTDAIEANGETSLKPTLLADYKRNLEVVNEAIKASQRTARSNPASPDAAEMLFAVYQSKLDLLSAVAEQSRPMIAQR